MKRMPPRAPPPRRLIGVDADEIGLMKSTSERVSTIALGLDWRPRDSIVAVDFVV